MATKKGKGKAKESKKKKKTVKAKGKKVTNDALELASQETASGSQSTAVTETAESDAGGKASKKVKNPSKKAKLATLSTEVDEAEEEVNVTFKDSDQPDRVHIPSPATVVKKVKAEKKRSKKNKDSVVPNESIASASNQPPTTGLKKPTMPKTPVNTNRRSRLSLIKQRLSTVRKSGTKIKPMTRRAAAAAAAATAARLTTIEMANGSTSSKPSDLMLNKSVKKVAIHASSVVNVNTPKTDVVRKIGHLEYLKNTAKKINNVKNQNFNQIIYF
jgi:hypothetical protein